MDMSEDAGETDYYVQLARNADRWAQGLTIMAGGDNLISIAQDFERRAKKSRDAEKKDAFLRLAQAVRQHVENVKAAHVRRLLDQRL